MIVSVNTTALRLVKEMMKADVGVKPHQIHYYLNKRFFEMFRSAIAAVPHMRQKAGAL